MRFGLGRWCRLGFDPQEVQSRSMVWGELLVGKLFLDHLQTSSNPIGGFLLIEPLGHRRSEHQGTGEVLVRDLACLGRFDRRVTSFIELNDRFVLPSRLHQQRGDLRSARDAVEDWGIYRSVEQFDRLVVLLFTDRFLQSNGEVLFGIEVLFCILGQGRLDQGQLGQGKGEQAFEQSRFDRHRHT